MAMRRFMLMLMLVFMFMLMFTLTFTFTFAFAFASAFTLTFVSMLIRLLATAVQNSSVYTLVSAISVTPIHFYHPCILYEKYTKVVYMLFVAVFFLF